jgi:hypothetical protein
MERLRRICACRPGGHRHGPGPRLRGRTSAARQVKDHAVAQIEPQFEAARAAEFERAGVDEADRAPSPARQDCVLGSPSRLRQRRKLDSLSPSRAQNGSIPRPLAANRAKTVSHSWRLRRRHLLLVAVALVTAGSSLMNVGGIVPRGREAGRRTPLSDRLRSSNCSASSITACA